jgi:hypothetical protein
LLSTITALVCKEKALTALVILTIALLANVATNALEGVPDREWKAFISSN